MYASSGQQSPWNPNAAPTQAPQPSQSPAQAAVQQQQQQQQQQQWPPQSNGIFARGPPAQIPPISQTLAQQQQPPPPNMQVLPQHPPHPDPYRSLPMPYQMGPPQYPQQPAMQYAPQQPTPRQRTAIACRYCRRRKIRCSGFDQHEDGRCTNCQRFNQECVFTPVSAQTQAFVPAHTVWRGQPPPANAQLYGAYGQPIRQEPYVAQPPPPQPGPSQAQQPGQYPPPPQGYQTQQYPAVAQMTGDKRPSEEAHLPTGAPPPPGTYTYPDPIAALTGRAESLSGLSDNTDRNRFPRNETRDASTQTRRVLMSTPPPGEGDDD